MVFKNGRQISGIPLDCKNLPSFQLMFGKKSDYEVFPSLSGKQLRIRKDFSNFFNGNINKARDSAFF